MIQVTIKKEELPGMTTKAHFIRRLKDAGIPVNGILQFGGVEEGVLARWDDPETGDIKFTWRDDAASDS